MAKFQMESKYIRSLIQGAQAGNNAALEQLFEMNLDRIYALSHRLSASRQDAESLAARVFVEAWNQLNKIRTDVPFNLWLESLSVHIALREQRELKEEKKRWGLFRKKKTEVKVPDPKLTPLGQEICKLPAPERNLFVLHYIERYSVDELSGMMDLSREKIKEKLEKVSEILMKNDFIQTREMLTKRISELPKQIKADKKILTEALQEIYKIKLLDRKENETAEGEQPSVEAEKVPEAVEKKPEEIKIKKEKGFELPEIAPGVKKRFGQAVFLIAALIAIYFVFTSGTKSWELNNISGAVSIDGEQLESSSSISPGEKVETAENSSATVLITGAGELKLGANTTFQHTDKKNSGELVKGKIKTNLSGIEEIFTLHVPGADISDYSQGSSYTAEVKDEESGYILINKGWISIKSNDREVTATTDYIVEFNIKTGCSIPYHKNAGPELTTAVREFLNTRNELHVERIVSLAGSPEALTLWNLLKSVSPGKRLLIYSKLNEIIPHSDTVSKEDVINLNSDKLQFWLEEIRKSIIR